MQRGRNVGKRQGRGKKTESKGGRRRDTKLKGMQRRRNANQWEGQEGERVREKEREWSEGKNLKQCDQYFSDMTQEKAPKERENRHQLKKTTTTHQKTPEITKSEIQLIIP